ncbi:universal stress protein [Halobacteriales archaeon QS_4_69_34]|jgi:nucleotide-binding universal stress UspA family protein|nr:MAG: universal stress protein [Halobacteriales archaeon QS_4_69_34]
MYDTILVPTNGSDEAAMAAEHAVGLAADIGATVHALYVIDLPGAPRALALRDDEERMRKEYREYGEEVTEALAGMAADAGVDCVTALRSGAVHEEIIDYADEEGMDAIVVGSGYQGKLGGLLGSVAEKVVRASTIPVISLRKGETD